MHARLRHLWPFLLVLLSLTSCGSGDKAPPEDQVADAPAQTLDEFVASLKEMLTQVPQPADTVYDLHYFEEDWQRETFGSSREYGSGKFELKKACLDRFGRIPNEGGLEFTSWPNETINVVEEGTESAIIQLTGPGHADREWHLIVVDGEWRRDATNIFDGSSPEPNEDRDRLDAGFRRMAAKYRSMAEKVRRGEITWDDFATDKIWED